MATEKGPAPGISSDDRLSEEGLRRLEMQLESGTRMSDLVLAQWIRRYGEPAGALIRKYVHYGSALDSI